MILIVDDHPQNIFSLKELLEINKFRVDTAASGEEALKKILQHTYFLIILDVQMPDMDGFEVAEAISGYSKSKDIPIIFLSAINTHKKYIAKGYSSGGVDYVTKPFDPDLLLLKVKTFYKLSEQHRQLSEMQRVLTEEIDVRKKIEGELQDRVEELKSTLESIPQMAFNTNAEGKIEFVNNRWSDYSSLNDQFPESDGLSISDCVADAIRSQHQFIQEVRIKRLDKAEFRYHILYLTPVKKDGSYLKWVGIFTDIHEQRMASQILEQKVEERTQALQDLNRKLAESNNELQQFAFVASHDLQEPLRKIQVFSAMLRKGKEDDNPETNKYLGKISQAAERMRRMITDLLDFARPLSKDMFAITNPAIQIDEIMSDLEVKIRILNPVIVIGQFPEMEIIPGQIKQLFQNLIVNALKFARTDITTEIHITSERVAEKSFDSETTEGGMFCRIKFRDNGIGFEQVYADRIFEIFQQLNQRDAYEGTGIGLSIVKKIVERHNGIIRADSKTNEGTLFTMVLPIKQPAS